MNIFEIMFTDSDEPRRPQQDATPFDDPLYKYQQPGHAADGVCRQLEHDALLADMGLIDLDEPLIAYDSTPRSSFVLNDADFADFKKLFVAHVRKVVSKCPCRCEGCAAEKCAECSGSPKCEAWQNGFNNVAAKQKAAEEYMRTHPGTRVTVSDDGECYEIVPKHKQSAIDKTRTTVSQLANRVRARYGDRFDDEIENLTKALQQL